MSTSSFNMGPTQQYVVPSCMVRDPVTGARMIVPATNPPQGAVYYPVVASGASTPVGTSPIPQWNYNPMVCLQLYIHFILLEL